jgi:hypothetical protein
MKMVTWSRLSIFFPFLVQYQEIHDHFLVPRSKLCSPDALQWVKTRGKDGNDGNDGTFPHGHLCGAIFRARNFLNRAMMADLMVSHFTRQHNRLCTTFVSTLSTTIGMYT